MKTAVIYWSGTGNTEQMASAIAEGAGAELFTISEFSGDIAAYDRIAFGCPAMGDEVLEESDFEPFFSDVEGTLNGKTIALFGCGDAESYCDTFCDGMGIIYEDIKDSGCTIVGKVSAKDYSFSSSIAVIDGMFVGLALDDINESDKTEERIDTWVSDIKNHLA